jgi:hypothetical protein
METFFCALRWGGSESEILFYFLYFSSLFPFTFLLNAILVVIEIMWDFAARSWGWEEA